ncbi:RlpA-like double-psi beta-barrel-protein domain-containing protein-containing protein [Earliella scabrosa]|nr:RlpA-like double-psi beta-barrel-protein domain-containing protein-containing protein [Earliella scabrosa]
MSNYGRSLLLAIFNFLALCSTLALAAPIQGSYDLAVRQPKDTIVMDKRYDDARFTYYDAGENACGGWDSNTDYVIALSPELYENGKHCWKSVTVQYNGKQVQAKVTDECPGCTGAQADLSRPLFANLENLDRGVIYGQWWFN